MKKKVFLRSAKLGLISLSLAFAFNVSPVSAQVCEDRLDARGQASQGMCSSPENCQGITGGRTSCAAGQICCISTSAPSTYSTADRDDAEIGSFGQQTTTSSTNSNPNVNGACGGGSCVAQGGCAPDQVSAGPCAGAGGTCCVKKTASTGSQATVNFSNPLEFNSVEEVLSSLLSTLQGIIVTLALVFLVLGAVLYIISGGSEERIGTAKKAITAAMIGLAIGLAAPSFLKEIGSVLGWGPVDNTALAGAKTLTQIALDVLHFLLSIVGILAIIMLLIGGLTYLTAAGDENRIETGKKIVTYSIIGIIIAFGSLVIVTQIASFFA